MTAPPDHTTTDFHAVIAELRKERDALAGALAHRNSEYGEGIKQQSATIDVLKVMSATPGDPQPVFDLIVRRARDLCNAAAAVLFEFDGRLVHFRARSGYDMDQTVQAEYQGRWPAAPTRDSITCRAILDKKPSLLARAPASACRSPTTSSPNSMAAASLWIAKSANTASS